MEKETIGKRISKLRKDLNMTQNDLAEKLCISNKAISKWEMENGTPNIEFLPEISNIFGVSIDYLLTGETNFVNQKIILKNELVSKEDFLETSIYTLKKLDKEDFGKLPADWLNEWSVRNNIDIISQLYREHYVNVFKSKQYADVYRLLNEYQYFSFSTIMLIFGWEYERYIKFINKALELKYIKLSNEFKHGKEYCFIEKDIDKFIKVIDEI